MARKQAQREGLLPMPVKAARPRPGQAGAAARGPSASRF
jgi:hypothetical protein